MVIELEQPPPAPEWPPGVVVTTFDPARAREFHAALEETFANEWDHLPESFEEWRERRLRGPTVPIRRSGSRSRTAPRSRPSLLADAARYGMGWVGALGVREPWRRRGLGLALLRHAFAELTVAGSDVIGLGVDAENPTGATRLYERAGMHVAWSAALYEKRLT